MPTIIREQQWPCACEYHFQPCSDSAEEKLLTLLADRKRIEKTEIAIVDTGNGTLARLNGRIDIDSSPAVRDRLLAVLQARDLTILTIDLSAVTHIDSSGVATLIEALKIARVRKTQLRLQGLHDRLHRLFDSTGMLSLFNGSDGI
jgi:anti-sigma B factor antagonist